MAKVSLSARVRTDDGEITTIAALADAGRILFDAIAVDGPKRNGLRKTTTKFFAFVKLANGESGAGWEIGETAYKSRTGQSVTIGGN